MKKLSLILAMVLGTFGFAMAQKTLTGKVSDAKGEPLVGASVVVKGTTTGSVTDLDGKYSLSVPASATTLVITYVGYKTSEVAIGASNVIDITLAENGNVLQDFVVTGTGTSTNRTKVAIDVQTLNAKLLPPAPTSSIDQALVGKIAGAQISSVGGSPGQGAQILLRGINTINRGTQPMIMMDGVEVGATDLNTLDLNTIERVEVVQGAAAASIYGAQGANGVIQVFTKKGKAGQLTVDFSTSFTNNTVLNTGGLKKATLHGFNTDANNNVVSGGNVPLTLSPTDGTWSAPLVFDNLNPLTQINKPFDKNLQYIDHFKMFLQDAPTTNNSLTVSGGSERFNFLVAASNNYQRSNFVGNGDYNRTNLTANIGVDIAKNLHFRTSTQIGFTTDKLNDGGGRATIYALFNTRQFVDYSKKLEDGTYAANQGNAAGVNGTNPFYINDYTTVLKKKIDLIQSFNLKYEPFTWLDLDAKYGINYRTEDNTQTVRNQSENLNYKTTDYYWTGDWVDGAEGEIDKRQRTTSLTNLLTTATFKFDLSSKIKSSTLVGYDYRNRVFRDYVSYGYGLPTYTPFTSKDAATQQIKISRTEPFVTFGYLVSQKFEFGEIAGISGGVRSDYSSAFGQGSKPFTFPRGDVYVRPSELDFWKNGSLGNVMPEFKVRAAFGSAGIQPKPFDRYVTLDTKNVGGANVFSLPSSQSNPDLNVEVSKEVEVGADISFKTSKSDWFNTVTFSPTYWTRSTENAIYDVDFIPSTGIGTYKDNSFSLGSNGFQFSLGAQIADKKDFSWKFTANFGQQVSKITKIQGPPVVLISGAGSTGYVLDAGVKVGQLFGYLGLHDVNEKDANGKAYIPEATQSAWEVASNGWVVNKASKQPYFTPNQYAFGDPNPKFNMSFINSITYKDMVTLNFQFDWLQGSHLYNQTKEWMYRDGIHSDYQEPITINGQTGAWAAFYRGVYAVSARNGTKNYFYEDASFVRLRNVELMFDLNKILSLKSVRRMQLVLGGRNLWTATKYTGMDPEVNSSNVYTDNGGGQIGNSAWDRGTDHNSLPNSRSLSIGLNLGF
jgi:TonB-dependent starch-binding outer membrane protein SusC